MKSLDWDGLQSDDVPRHAIPPRTAGLSIKSHIFFSSDQNFQRSSFSYHKFDRLAIIMTHSIKTIGVVGTGVIGASWTALFLAQGLRVLVSDPAPGAKDNLLAYLKRSWPMLKRLGLHENASISNYTFVGGSLDEYCHEVDFIQEVHGSFFICIKRNWFIISQNAPEKLELKRKLLATLDSKTRSDIVIASSSSGIPSSKFIVDCANPERILIGHPFNPPHLVLSQKLLYQSIA